MNTGCDDFGRTTVYGPVSFLKEAHFYQGLLGGVRCSPEGLHVYCVITGSLVSDLLFNFSHIFIDTYIIPFGQKQIRLII